MWVLDQRGSTVTTHQVSEVGVGAVGLALVSDLRPVAQPRQFLLRSLHQPRSRWTAPAVVAWDPPALHSRTQSSGGCRSDCRSAHNRVATSCAWSSHSWWSHTDSVSPGCNILGSLGCSAHGAPPFQTSFLGPNRSTLRCSHLLRLNTRTEQTNLLLLDQLRSGNTVNRGLNLRLRICWELETRMLIGVFLMKFPTGDREQRAN